jgi:signal transduction histidine kinase
MKIFSFPQVRFLLGVALILALSLVVFYFYMQPPMSDLGQMARFLSITALISAAAGFIAYRTGWMYLSPSIRWTLIGGYALSSILAFINIWVTARLMFASQHDLQLATILLLFAGGIAMVLGFFFASALTDRIGWLKNAARRITQGDLETRLTVQGNDEIADLAKTFNTMAEQLQAGAARQKELENMRRDLIAWVSHDLQTPLASVRAIVEALADGMVDDPETVQRYLRTAQKDIGALSMLIDDLFQMAQIDAGGLKLEINENSISDLISDTLESFSELAQRQGVHLEGRVDPGLDIVSMDAPRIGRVLNNLVNNALRHTSDGGTVMVSASSEGAQVRIDVTDTGEGIRSEDLPLVFDQFFRGERSRNRSTGGSGLGLAITRGIIEAHGGRIEVYSSPGEGTKFTFTLPN